VSSNSCVHCFQRQLCNVRSWLVGIFLNVIVCESYSRVYDSLKLACSFGQSLSALSFLD